VRHSPFRSGPERSSQSGFTRVEFLVLAGILLLLAVVAYFPVSEYLAKTRLARAVESAHVISTLLSQYATDNNGVYPIGEGTPAVGRSEGIARNLLENNYTPDATPFAIGTTKPYISATSDYSNLAGANISWDFTAGVTPTTGITSAAPDNLPVVYTTGETVAYPTTPGAGLDLVLSGKGPLGDRGIIVAYKGNNAVFIPGVPSGTIPSESAIVCAGFIPKTYQDTGSYTQIKP
jgi:type II secretory pathway pseudopilin PulG